MRRKDYKALASSPLHKQLWVKKKKQQNNNSDDLENPELHSEVVVGLLLRAKISFFVVVPNKISGAGKHTDPRSTSLGNTETRGSVVFMLVSHVTSLDNGSVERFT